MQRVAESASAGRTASERRASIDFRSIYRHGFARVAACTLRTCVADPKSNAEAVVRVARACHDDGVAVAVFPELTLSGYAIEDLLLQEPLLDGVERALSVVVEASRLLSCVLVVGAPLRHRHRVYNTAVVIHRGHVLGVAPKSYLPTYREFYERRQLAPGDDQGGSIMLLGAEVPFGPDLLFEAQDVPGLVLHVEICEDMWVPVPPSSEAALAGATVLANLSASPINVGRADDRRVLCRSASGRCIAAYVFAAAGEGESTTDLAWDGQTMVYENGVLLAETDRFPQGDRRAVADVDLGMLAAERRRIGTFDDNRRHHAGRLNFRTVGFRLSPPTGDIGLRRSLQRFPFAQAGADGRAFDCAEVYAIQVSGLEQRLRETGDPKVILGISGGLDSTQALLVAAQAMDRQGRPRSDILAFTMPGLATGEQTRGNALRLMRALGVTHHQLDITAAARLMLRDIGHPYAQGEPVYDVTFQNVQAGLRTDYLFRIANFRRGIVLGTADLSELALGWLAYGVGDQMAHYNVNAGIPKTLIQQLIRWNVSSGRRDGELTQTLQAILDTEITPELVPADADGHLQSTEAAIGPHTLQDFTLYHVLRHGFGPAKIAFLSWHAWHDVDAGQWPPDYPLEHRVGYDLPEIRHWLGVFLQRFFGFSQFKRSALPNGPKVCIAGTLSPRGDWRAPSDASARVWLQELQDEVPQQYPADPAPGGPAPVDPAPVEPLVDPALAAG